MKHKTTACYMSELSTILPHAKLPSMHLSPYFLHRRQGYTTMNYHTPPLPSPPPIPHAGTNKLWPG